MEEFEVKTMSVPDLPSDLLIDLSEEEQLVSSGLGYGGYGGYGGFY